MERVYLPLYKVGDIPFPLQGDGIFQHTWLFAIVFAVFLAELSHEHLDCCHSGTVELFTVYQDYRYRCKGRNVIIQPLGKYHSHCEVFSQCRGSVGSTSVTFSQHWAGIGWTLPVSWVQGAPLADTPSTIQKWSFSAAGEMPSDFAFLEVMVIYCEWNGR